MVVGVLQDEGNNPYPVAATGFLLGSQFTIFLYGLHVCQVARYYNRFGKTDKNKYRYILVPLVLLTSSAHVGMIIFSVHHYFVQGFLHPTIWDTFYGGLSGQDFVIPIMSFISHLFFGHRIYVLQHIKLRYWIAFICFASTTCLVGLAFATLARIWSMHPLESVEKFKAMSIGPAADSLPTAWLSCAALIDGSLTASLLYIVLREHRQHREHTRQLLYRIAGLTLETVLLTHVIGATLFVLWLTSRTRTNAFWFFIEIIAETYALSVLFTLNSRSRLRRAARPNSEHMIDRQLNHLDRLEAGDSGAVYPPQLESASPPEIVAKNLPIADVDGVRGVRAPNAVAHVVWSDSLETEKADSSHTNSLRSSDEEKAPKNSTNSSLDDVGESRLFLPSLATAEITATSTGVGVGGHRRFRSSPSALR